MKTNEERLKHLMDCLDRQTHVKPEQIPDIDLYMDQVTTFMEEHLKDTRRYPDDKVLTKTMINNYAKNNLLPPPVKKKYSKDHMLMLIFIYYFKSLLAFNDIETLFAPITSKHFSGCSSKLSLEDIYRGSIHIRRRRDEKSEGRCGGQVRPGPWRPSRMLRLPSRNGNICSSFPLSVSCPLMYI